MFVNQYVNCFSYFLNWEVTPLRAVCVWRVLYTIDAGFVSDSLAFFMLFLLFVAGFLLLIGALRMILGDLQVNTWDF